MTAHALECRYRASNANAQCLSPGHVGGFRALTIGSTTAGERATR